MWPTGGAWLCKHLWDHYDYGRDRAYLAEVYPLLKGAAQFFLDTLVADPSGKFLVTSPSISPENAHPHGASICAGPAMDNQILRDLFANCIRAAEILGMDADFRKACAATRAKLPPDRIGKAGQLQEWMEDWDMEAPERDHRHVSHLYGLFPSEQITRAPHAGAGGGRANARSNCAAICPRAGRSPGASISGRGCATPSTRMASSNYCSIRRAPIPTCSTRTRRSRSTATSAAPTASLEMLLQCVDGEIELLPALPRAWAQRVHSRPARSRRFRGGHRLARRRAAVGGAARCARGRGAGALSRQGQEDPRRARTKRGAERGGIQLASRAGVPMLLMILSSEVGCSRR